MFQHAATQTPPIQPAQSSRPSLKKGIQSLPIVPLKKVQPRKQRELPFPTAMRERMEQSFHTDFSNMRFYESPTPAAVHAKALTSGNQAFFAPGCFSPHSQTGQQLIGHELSHAAAQSRGVGANGSGILYNPQLEARADREGLHAAHGRPVTNSLPWTEARPLAAPVFQGYFTLLPGGYTLTSDGLKAAFTTHQYLNLNTDQAADPALQDYAAEFDAPPAGAALPAPVVATDPGANDPVFQDLRREDSLPPPQNQMQERFARRVRLESHRIISDRFAAGMGSGNPAFLQNISRDQTTHVDRYAAIGVHRYTGKVALYVADNGSFAVNAQTPEPKEAYMLPADILQSNAARHSNVQLEQYGNALTIPLAGGINTVLQMVRPKFDGNYQRGQTFDCGIFSGYVCPNSPPGAAETPARMRIYSELDPDAALRRSDMRGQAARLQRLTTIQQQMGIPANQGNQQLIRDFKHVFDPVTARYDRKKVTAENYETSVRNHVPDINPANVRRVGSHWYSTIRTLSQLGPDAGRGIVARLKEAYVYGLEDELAQIYTGEDAEDHSPASDVARVIEDQRQHLAEDQGLALNAGAAPAVGQRYQIKSELGHGWIYHFGGVIAASGGDTLTLENYHKGAELTELFLQFAQEQEEVYQSELTDAGKQAALTALNQEQQRKHAFFGSQLLKTWFFNIQGMLKPGQSFHEKQDVTGAYGIRSITSVK